MKKKAIYSYVYLIVAVILSSCTAFEKVKIVNNQKFYAYDYSRAPDTIGLKAYTNSEPFYTSIREESEVLFFSVSPDDESKIDDGTIVTEPPKPSGLITTFEGPTTRTLTIQPNFYYSIKEGNYAGQENPVLRYNQWKVYLQTIAVPLKFRRPVGNVSAQVESGPTFAIASGVRHSWNWYKGKKNPLGLNTTALSLGAGGMIGMGIVDINSKTTQGKVLDEDATKNMTIPVGLHLVGGVNNIHLGFAIGWDIITGPNASKWDYKGQMWTGVIVGLDIIK